MNKNVLSTTLTALSLGSFRYFDQTTSTNAIALQWADEGAPDCSLVVADEQTAGRGRMGSKWFTPPGSALAISLILHPTADEQVHPSRITGLLAVSLAESLRARGLNPQIKWPNDVLLNGCKVAGILVESSWTGDKLDALVLGMGVNVLKESVPPKEDLLFPATSLEDALGRPVNRVELLKDILTSLLAWRPKLGSGGFLKAWEQDLAFRGQHVRVGEGSEEDIKGELLGLEADGSLLLRDECGKSVTVRFGDVHLRPMA